MSEASPERTAAPPARPRVTIGVPVWNGEDLLPGALDALLAQRFGDFELIISDNASTDSTPEICARYVAADPRVRYVRQPVNHGPLANFHALLDEARGEYFMWAAHDDLWEPDFLARLARELDERPGAVLAFCGYDIIDYSGKIVRSSTGRWKEVFQRSKFRQLYAMITLDEEASQKASHIYGLMRLDAIRRAARAARRIDAYDGNDVCMLLGLLGQGDFAVVDDLLFHYRVRDRTPHRKENPAISPRHSALGYLWRRLVHGVPGHRHTLASYLRSDRQYFSGIREIVREFARLPGWQRALLRGATVLHQVRRPVRVIMAGVRNEL